MIGRYARKHHLVEIQPLSEHDHQCYNCNGGIVAFRTSPHQDQEWSKKVDDKTHPEHASVSTMCTRFEVNRFFGNVRIPDQHKLRKPQVCPKDNKREHELSNVMNVFL